MVDETMNATGYQGTVSMGFGIEWNPQQYVVPLPFMLIKGTEFKTSDLSDFSVP